MQLCNEWTIHGMTVNNVEEDENMDNVDSLLLFILHGGLPYYNV